MTTKQPKQPRPGPGRVIHRIPPLSDGRPTKAAPVASPDAARSIPHTIHDGGALKGRDRASISPQQEHQRKPPFEAPRLQESDVRTVVQLPDQKPLDERVQTVNVRGGDEGQRYVRLRMRLRGDQMSVIDSHLVEGPLGQVTGFPGTNAYEVTLDERLLHAGALPDLGVQRSFPNPAGPESQHGHFITERDVVEFTARVPAEMLTPETIGRVRVTLHRVSEEAQAQRLGTEPLARQFERQVRPLATLEGLPETVLPQAIEARGGTTPSV